jgi:DNA primase catalytic core
MLSFVEQCQQWLSESPAVMDYLMERRHLTPESIKESKIGYFPVNAHYPFPPKAQELKLKNRITVPIFSEFGKVVGIAGRIPDPKEKGWWNTSFSKSSHLYGFSDARQSIFKNNKAYVFEGYLDRIVLSQNGLANSVAAMSTNLGIRRLGLLSRYCDQLCLCFDTDQNEAGFAGCLRTLADMYMMGIGIPPSSWKITMITLPVKVDPDDFVFQNGLDAFLALEKPISEQQLKVAGKAYELLKYRLKLKQKRNQNDN